MKVLVVGSGGREHALCWKLARSPRCSALVCAPGNAGIEAVARCAPVKADDIDGLVTLASAEKADLVVIGPEAPLTIGLADALRNRGFAVFGPDEAAARLEKSKAFMKDVLRDAGVPTAGYATFESADAAKAYIRAQQGRLVVKTDGLAAGKGVILCTTPQEAQDAVDLMMRDKAFGEAGSKIVIEEFLEGEEVSFFALCDGHTAVPLAAAQDHKAVGDGDTGPNTGGMGAYSPAPVFSNALEAQVMKTIILPTLDRMKALGAPFSGVLFAGLMITPDGPKVLEYNIRFGDPECQVLMMRWTGDLLEALHASATGTLQDIEIAWSTDAALVVVMAAEGYPGPPKTGTVIRGLDRAGDIDGVEIFHAGTGRNDRGDIVATGGRVLGIAARGETVKIARERAYAAVDAIDWPEGFCRRDIAWRALPAK